MYILNSLFVILFLISLGCLVAGLRLKRKNIGFLIMSGVIALTDLLCAALVNVKNAAGAGRVLLPYYILHGWMLFSFLIMVIMIDRYRQFIAIVAVSLLVSIYQTYLAVSQYFGARVFSFQKRIYFRKAWWVAADSKNTGLLFSFRSYRLAGYINLALILIILAACIIYSHKIFRMKYISHIVMMLGYSVLESLTIHFLLPVWIPVILFNLLPVFCLFYTGMYADNRLRAWSLDNFANDMSDGLILYNSHDDLIHINDMIKTTLSEDLVDSFVDKTKLSAWIEDNTSDVAGKETVIYENNGRKYYFHVNVSDFGGHGNHVGTLYILHDSTDSTTRIRAMKHANEELERASRMKSDFLANMSHEIRTPMNAVIGMAEIAMREKDPAQIYDYLRQIQRSGRNLLNIINDILDYSKIESGKMEIIEEEYEPFIELEDIANVLATRIGDKPLELFVYVDRLLPHKLLGDNMRIRQILINLANNAIKFTHQGMVKIRIDGERIAEDTVKATFHVIDTGIGIKKEDIEKLFVSFQQVDSRRNRSAEGTGLGLAISQRLVEAMGGEIGVTSEYGKGSDFWFSIPQKVVDGNNDLEIHDADDKHAICMTDQDLLWDMFSGEMKNLELEFEHITSFDEYRASGKRDFIFFEQKYYDDKATRFFEAHPDINGVIYAEFGTDLEITCPNIHIQSRPATTMRMVRTLNEQYDEVISGEPEKTFSIDFMAPDAEILVVDDNDINLTIAKGLLEPIKVQVDIADGGQSAIDKAVAKDYDIILMDHMMPEIDGVDATVRIRELRGEADKTVIIALSANAVAESRSLFADAGMNDFVAKPIDVKDLITTVKKWLPEEKIVPVTDADGTLQAGEGLNVSADDGVRLPDIEGLDVESAVKALGSAKLYDKIAGEYYLSGQDKLEGIKKAYEAEDWPDYTIRVHALKSSSRQIGAMKLGDMAEALEKAGKAGDIDTIKADTKNALSEFDSLLSKLKDRYAEDEDDSDKPPIDRDTLNELLDRLESACDELDMDDMEDVSSSLKEYNHSMDTKDLIEGLYKAVSEIDTEKCLDIIGQLRG